MCQSRSDHKSQVREKKGQPIVGQRRGWDEAPPPGCPSLNSSQLLLPEIWQSITKHLPQKMHRDGKVGSQDQPRKESMQRECGEEDEFGKQSVTSESQGNNWLSGQTMDETRDEHVSESQESQQGMSQPQREQCAWKAKLEKNSQNKYNIYFLGTDLDQLEVFQKLLIEHMALGQALRLQ